MRDVTRKQVRVLFELSNGKKLYVNKAESLAFLSEAGTPDDGDVDHFQDYLTLFENDCLTDETNGASNGLDVYAISTEGIERLLETSMRPEEG